MGSLQVASHTLQPFPGFVVGTGEQLTSQARMPATNKTPRKNKPYDQQSKPINRAETSGEDQSRNPRFLAPRGDGSPAPHATTSFGPDATRTEPSTVCGANHHGRGGHRLLSRVCHGPGTDELLALPGVPATARQPVSLGRQVRSGDGPTVLSGGGVCLAHESGVHPAGHLQDGQPDERTEPKS